MIEGARATTRTRIRARVGAWTVLVDLRDLVELAARVAIEPLPGAPRGVRGVLRHRGELAVAIDLRERFGAPAPEGLWDPMIIVRGAPRWALIVDSVEDLDERAAPVAAAPSERIAGVALQPDGAALIVEPQRLLDDAEKEALRAALDRARDREPA